MSQSTYFTLWRVAVFAVALAVGIILALTPYRAAEQFPALGTTAERDVTAETETTFVSTLLTEDARETARADAVVQFEFSPDVRPAQLEALALYLDDVLQARWARNAAPVNTPSTEGDADDSPSVAESQPSTIAGSKLTVRDEMFLLAISDPLFASIQRHSQSILGALLDQRIHAEDIDSVRFRAARSGAG